MSRLKLVFALFCLLATAALPAVAAGPVPNFGDTAFANVWNRVDKPVQQIPSLGRGYTWGPVVAGSENITSEPYNGGTRKVQYFEKARMEINNPSANPSDLFFVSAGLLVKELVTGFRQDGDNTFTQLAPSQVQVAGDPNDNGANAIAPTYASFQSVATFQGTQNGKPDSTGTAIAAAIDKAGNLSTIAPPETRLNQFYDSVTQHNIADVFVAFGNQNGLIWDGQTFTQGSVFFGNPTYVLGRPVTEAYWVRAVVGGTEKPVLVQLFERRVLTYTPDNPAGFKVEMGNVGQHYFKWRYSTNNSNPAPATQGGLTVAPSSGLVGQVFQVTGSGFTSNEPILVWETDPLGKVTALSGPPADASGNFVYSYNSHGPLVGVWYLTAHGKYSGVEKSTSLVLQALPKVTGPYLQLSRSQISGSDSIDVRGYGFTPNERYTFWLTAPDGKVYPGTPPPSGQTATPDGIISFTITAPAQKPGTWGITVRGATSGKSAVAFFTLQAT